MVKLDATAKEVRYGTWEIGGPRHYYRERLILKNLQKFIANGRVLDVGCGTGSLLTKLAVGGYKVYGIDMSEECLEITSKRLKRFSSNNHGEVKKGNASQIDYPTDFFDAVIAAEVMEHLEEDYLAVKEVHRVLRPGGISLITVPANPGLWDIWDEKAGHKRRYRREDFLKLYNGQLFHIEKIFSWGFPLVRLYHRLIFLKWARHVEDRGRGTISTEDTLTRIGLSQWATVILGNIFRIDNIFGWLPWGIGFLVIARKIEK